LSVQEKQAVNIPVWAGVGAIVIGAGLLLIGGKKASQRVRKLFTSVGMEKSRLGKKAAFPLPRSVLSLPLSF